MKGSKFHRSVFLKAILVPVFTLPAIIVFGQTDTSRTLHEVSVNANKALVVPSITPVQQINSQDFIKSGSFNVADAVRTLSGVNIKDYGGIGGIKTISVRGLGAGHTAVFYDGLQLNDAETGQIDLSKLSLINIRSITFYNGQPDNLLQPARAFAAASVLSLQTVPAQLGKEKAYEITAGVKGGSFGLFNPYVLYQQRLSKRWTAVVTNNYINANGRYKFDTPNDGSDTLSTRHNSQVRSLQTDAALYWNKNDSSLFSVHANFYNAKRGLPGAVVFYTESPGEKLDNDDIFLQASYKHIWKNSLQLLLNSKVSQLKARYLDSPYFNTQGYILQHYKQREAYQSAALSYNLTNNWAVYYAVDGSYTKVDADVYKYAYPSRFTLLNALASKLKFNRWELAGNLLHTYINEKVERGKALQQSPVLSPTLILGVQPFASKELKLRAFYKNIFRAPTLDELYYFAFVDRVIKPEFVNQYDLGATYNKDLNGLLSYVFLSTDVYYNNVRDKIIGIPSANPAVFSFSNIGRVDVKGLDFGLKTSTRNFGSWSLSLTANYTYQQALDVTDPALSTYLQQIAYTPKHTLALNTGINFKKLGIYYNQIISSKRNYNGDNDPEHDVPGYAVGDASILYNTSFEYLPLRLSVEANNIFDKYYAIIQSYPMPGRSYRLTMQITI
ncbi:TonB-dependent receptor [Mucilaginibacter sp. 21P]|uniref:TonB-dependent receptor plug domain-containing protein n=1 Tax=Mucilaginibacter sp. 21P TaxID=2778902 RepID=UPI001C576E99|nr:TonB-dependent receptor [Mucilaginibacter sp. 21P]QXV64398.1 TonB-dependent receptor [Mucilaginibacter sp. 21P]